LRTILELVTASNLSHPANDAKGDRLRKRLYVSLDRFARSDVLPSVSNLPQCAVSAPTAIAADLSTNDAPEIPVCVALE